MMPPVLVDDVEAERVAPTAGWRQHRAMLLLSALLSGQVLLAVALIPPWQNADEPQHLATVRLALSNGTAFNYDTPQVDVERAIVKSMAHFGWWTYYGRPTPDPLPVSFADGPRQVVAAYFGPPSGGSRLYYRAVAGVFRITGVSGILPQLYAMRLLSAGASVLTLMCLWAGTRLLLGTLSAFAVAAMMALHPQYVVLAATGGPDAFVYLACAIVWWQAAALIAKPANAASLAAMWGGAIAAFLLRRLGAPILLIAAGMTLWTCTDALTMNRSKIMRFAIGAAAALICLGAVVNAAAPDELRRAFEWATRFDIAASLNAIHSNIDQLPRFVDIQFQAFWLSAGWLPYFASDGWYLVVRIVMLTAVAGLVVNCREINTRAVLLSVAMVAVQLMAIIAYHFGYLQAGPSGRYLLPVLPAVLCLIWSGCRTWFGAQQPLAAVVMIAIAAVLNISAWTFVLLPAFA